jgi:peptidoglycan/LPS O-acetylase OafA/YrhL
LRGVNGRWPSRKVHATRAFGLTIVNEECEKTGASLVWSLERMLPSGKSTRSSYGNHIAFLDGIRGFAALIVVISHFSNRAMRDVDVDALLGTSATDLSFSAVFQLALGAVGSGAGQIGVMIFFVLSSFLMFHLYFEKASSSKNLWNFAVGRVARIFPLYYLVLFVAVFVSLFAPFQFIEITLRELPAHLIFAQGNSVLWTIAPELVFYCLFAFFWIIAPKTLWPMGILAAGFVLVSNALPVFWKSYTADFFVAGFLLYAYTRSNFKFGFHRLPTFVPPILFVSVLSFHLPVIYRVLMVDLPMNGWQTTHYVLMVFLLFVLVFESKPLQEFFQSRIMSFFGNISFSVYLLHLLVFHFLLYYDLIGPDVVSLTVALLLVILLSAAVFNLYETPMRLWIRSRYSRKVPFVASSDEELVAVTLNRQKN